MHMVKGSAGPATQAESCARAWAAVSRGRRVERDVLLRCAGLGTRGGGNPKGGARLVVFGEAGDAGGMAASASMGWLGLGDSGGDDSHGAAGTYEQVNGDAANAASGAAPCATGPQPATCCLACIAPLAAHAAPSAAAIDAVPFAVDALSDASDRTDVSPCWGIPAGDAAVPRPSPAPACCDKAVPPRPLEGWLGHSGGDEDHIAAGM